MSLFGSSTPAPAFGAASTPAFGAAPASSAFGAASTPAFGAAPTSSAFGAVSTPGFGATTAPAFGAASTPAFGATPTSAFGASSTPSFFGAASTPAATTPSLFGAAPSPSPFGAASTPAAGGLFGTSTTPGLFGASSAAAATPSLFGNTTPAAGTGLFGGAAAGATLQPQAGALCTKDNKPLAHSTKWDDIHPSAQNALLELEKQIVAYRDQCQQLDKDSTLADTVGVKKTIKAETDMLSHSLQALMSTARTDYQGMVTLKEKVLKLLRETEVGCRSFERSKQWRHISRELMAGQIQPGDPRIQEAIGGPPILPAPYFEEAIKGMEEVLSQYRGTVLELQGLISQRDMQMSEEGAVGALETALNNMHDYFVHVAAKVDVLYSRIQLSKDAHLASRRQAGDLRDPFEEAAERAAAKEQADAQAAKARIAARAANPPLQAAQQPATAAPALTAGAFGTTPVGQSAPAAATPVTGSLFGASPSPGALFGTPQPATTPQAPAAGTFGGTTGAGGLFGASAAPTVGAFGSTSNFGNSGSGSMTRSKSKGRKK